MMRDRNEENMDGYWLKWGETLLQGDRLEDRVTDRYTGSYTGWWMVRYTQNRLKLSFFPQGNQYSNTIFEFKELGGCPHLPWSNSYLAWLYCWSHQKVTEQSSATSLVLHPARSVCPPSPSSCQPCSPVSDLCSASPRILSGPSMHSPAHIPFLLPLQSSHVCAYTWVH